MSDRTFNLAALKRDARFGTTALLSSLGGLIGLVIVAHDARGLVTHGGRTRIEEAGETALLLGLVVLGAWLAGRLFRRWGLPTITGQLAFGVAIGPALWSWLGRPELALMSRAQLESLKGIELLAIVMIGLVAGSEVDARFLRARAKAILALGICQTVLALCVVSLVGAFLLRSAQHAVIIAMIASTSSSAVAIALLREMRHPTEFARLLLATTVSKDLVLVTLFSVALPLLVGGFELGSHAHAWDSVIWQLAGSIGIGFSLAVPLAFIIGRVQRRVGAVVIVLAIFLVVLCNSLSLVGLVTAVTFGFTMRSLAPERTEPFFATARRLFLAVCCMFFAASGAHLDFASLAAHWPIVIALSLARWGSIWVGASAGARIAGLSPAATMWAGAGFLPQAGMSLALAAQLLAQYPGAEWATQVSTIVIACIALGEVLGPVLMRMALRRVP